MNKDRSRKRSKSSKRKTPLSCERHMDETLLIKMLDERARITKNATASQDDFSEHKDCRSSLQALKLEFSSAKKRWKSQQKTLKSTQLLLKQENHELKEKISVLESKLKSEVQIPVDHQLNLTRIKESLRNLEALVSFRSENSNKVLLNIHKLLAKHAKILFDQPLSVSAKSKLTLGIKKISQATTSIQNLLCGQAEEDGVKENSEAYKIALEKMKNQTVLLREKLKELENGDGLKQIIEEQDSKIEALMKEKELLKVHIKNLQHSLNDQSNVINDLKTVMQTKKESRNQTPYSSPERPTHHYKSYIDHDEKDLQAEIADLDSEIQQLQSSLKRALVNN